MRGEALKGHLDFIVLALLADGPLHGYAVMRRLRQQTDGAFDLPEGTVYPVLHRLERAGLLAGEWRAVEGRNRLLYSLTPSGRSALGERHVEWKKFVTAVEATLRGSPWPKTS